MAKKHYYSKCLYDTFWGEEKKKRVVKLDFFLKTVFWGLTLKKSTQSLFGA